MEQMTNAAPETGGKRLKKGGRKAPLFILVLLALLAAGFLGVCAYAAQLDGIFPGVRVMAHPVGGLSETEAAELLEEQKQVTDWPFELIPVTEEDHQLVLPEATSLFLSPEELGGVEIDTAASARLAWEYCHGGSFLVNGWHFLCAAADRGFLPAVLTAPALSQRAPVLARELSLPPVHGSYALLGQEVAITAPRDGYALSAREIETAVRQALARYEWSAPCPGTPLPARSVTARDAADALCGAMENAHYDKEQDAVLPERIGVSFDVNAAQQLLEQAVPSATITVPAQVEQPTVTAEYLNSVLFRDLLGECTTKVGGTPARKTNVRLSSEAFNGTVLLPGEVFSYNDTVGQRTAEKGYQAAPAYVKGETVDEIGGGVCQPSSTLYLACLRADLEITERYAHRYLPAYIPAGMDATVSWQGPDYKFTNSTDFPLRIETSYENKHLTVRLWGTNSDGITAKVTNKWISTTEWETEYVEDPELAPGTEEVKTTPYTGHKFETYRHRYDKDGKWLSTDFEATSNYKARNKVIARGPGTVPELPSVNPQPLPDQPGETDPALPTEPAEPVESAKPTEPTEPAPLPQEPTAPAEPEEEFSTPDAEPEGGL